MVLVSYSGKEINAKLVYYGPGLSGKTTNLEYIYGSIPGNHRGKMVSMKTKTERTLFFDFLPVQLGELSGFKTRFLLYTVPGQVYYNATRKLVLKGVDAVVFVADSKRGKMDENVESLENLKENLREHGLDIDTIPWALQYNKRDLPEVYSVAELDQVLNPLGVPTFEAVATKGTGVIDTFKGVSKLLLKKLSQEVGVPVVGATEAPTVGGAPVQQPSAPAIGSAPAPAPPTSAPAAPIGGTPPAAPPTMKNELPSMSAPVEAPPAADATSGTPSGGAATPTAGGSSAGSGAGAGETELPSMSAPIGEEPAIQSQPVFETFAGPETNLSSTNDSSTSNSPPTSVEPPAASSVDDDDLPPISREPKQENGGGVRGRLARWLRRGDDSQGESMSDSAPEVAPIEMAPEATAAGTSASGGADSAEGSTRNSFFDAASTSPAETEAASAPSEPGLRLELEGTGAFGSSAEAGSAGTSSTESAPASMDSSASAPAPAAASASASTDDSAAPATSDPAASSSPFEFGPESSSSLAAGRVPGEVQIPGQIAGAEPREVVVPVRLSPEDLQHGLVLKIRIESAEGKKAA